MSYEDFKQQVQSGMDEKLWTVVRSVLRLKKTKKCPDTLLFTSKTEYERFSKKHIEDLKSVLSDSDITDMHSPITPVTRILYLYETDELIGTPFIAFDPEGYNQCLKYNPGIDPEVVGISTLVHEQSEVGIFYRNRDAWLHQHKWYLEQREKQKMSREDISLGHAVLMGISHNFIFDCQRHVLNRLGYEGRKIILKSLLNEIKELKEKRVVNPYDITLLLNSDYLARKKENDESKFYQELIDWKPKKLSFRDISKHWERLKKYSERNNLRLRKT